MPTMTIDVRDFKKIGVLFKDISDKTLRQAAARSISRTLTTVRKTAVTDFRAAHLISMKSSTMKRRIRAYNHAKGNQPVSEQFGEITISGKPESMARFYAKRIATPTKNSISGKTLYGVTVNSLGREAMASYASAAFFMMKNGSKINAVFSRSGKGRLPIEKQTGPSLGRIAQDHGLLASLRKVAADRYATEFAHNVEFYMARSVAKAASAK